jgi:hypothetical protein
LYHNPHSIAVRVAYWYRQRKLSTRNIDQKTRPKNLDETIRKLMTKPRQAGKTRVDLLTTDSIRTTSFSNTAVDREKMRVAAVAIFLLLMQSASLTQDTPEELRKIAENPFADEIRVPVEEDITFSQGPYNRSGNSLQIQPVFPLSIARGWLLIPRIVATAIAYQPNLTAKKGGITGLGDSTIAFFLSPTRPGPLIWGLGPVVLIPTATSDRLGFGKWGLGPSLAMLVEPEWGSIGGIIQNIWSVAGGPTRSPVNQLQLEPMFFYNLPRGWYLTTQPTVTADWTQPTNNRWLLPIGGGAGKTFNIEGHAIDANLAVYWHAVRSANNSSPTWQLSVQFAFLFSKPSKKPSN